MVLFKIASIRLLKKKKLITYMTFEHHAILYINHVLGSTFELIHAYGNPVGVSNAGRKRRPKSSARISS